MGNAFQSAPSIPLRPRSEDDLDDFVSFWEWFCSLYPPDEYVYNTQHYFATIKPAASSSSTGTLSVQVPLYAFGFRSKGINTTGGAAVSIPYRIGIALLSGNDWTFGNWFAPVITGDGQAYEYTFYWPREVPASTQLTVTIDNTINNTAGGITVDAGIVGLEPRKRDVPIERMGRRTGARGDGMFQGAR
jgi:hypothetical protein